MSGLPEQIWAFKPDIFDNVSLWQNTPSPNNDTTQYIRADLCDPLSDPRVAALVEVLEVYKEGCDWQTPPPHCDRPSYMCCKPAREALDMLKGTSSDT